MGCPRPRCTGPSGRCSNPVQPIGRTEGLPRVLPRAGLERYCELIAALKLRTTNKQGRHLSTQRTIELLEQYGVETPQGLIRAPQGVLHKTTVNVYLRHALIGFRGLSRPTTQ
jgi:hypothetical protein